MEYKDKTKEELQNEIAILRKRVEEMEKIISCGCNGEGENSVHDDFSEGGLSENDLNILNRYSVETAAEEVFWMNDDSRIVYVNELACRRLGYTKDEMLKMHIWDWNPLVTEEKWKAHFNDMPVNGVKIIETQHRTKDGEIVTVEVRSGIFELRGRKLVLASVNDITEWKMLEESLVRKNREFEAIFNSITDAIVFTDTSRTIVMVNPAFTEISGYSRQEAVGKSTLFFYDTPESFAMQEKLRFNLDTHGVSPNYVTRYRRKDGTFFWSDTLGVRVNDDNGNIIGFLGIIRDITDRIEAEREIQENRARLLACLDSMTDGIMISDSDGRNLEMNEAWARLSGYENKEEYLKVYSEFRDFTGEEGFELTFEDGTPAPPEEWATPRALRGEKKTNVIYRIYVKDTGKTYFYSFSFSPIRNEKSGIIGSVVVSRDVTEQKRNEELQRGIEERLRQAEKMESLGTLAEGIAHNFNNILGTIMGYTEMARLDYLCGKNTVENLSQVLDAADRAKDLVRDILAFSSKGKVEPRPMKIQPVINEAMKMVRSSIPAEITMVHDIDPDCRAVLADSGQVHQIFYHLGINACHAMEEKGGVLSVTLRNALIQTEDHERLITVPEGEFVELVVSDTGTGMEKSIADKIFEPFFTTKEQGKGTGMGLSVVYGMVKGAGGGIYVDSVPGEGSAFHIYFPVTAEPEKAVKNESMDIPHGKGRILFVDDEILLTQMAKLFLEKLGYDVTEAHDGLDALKVFQGDPESFDMVITDQTMPELTGSDLAAEIVKIRPDLPIVLCSGYSNVVDEATAKTLGIRGFLPKPFFMETIAEVIRNVIDETTEDTCP